MRRGCWAFRCGHSVAGKAATGPTAAWPRRRSEAPREPAARSSDRTPSPAFGDGACRDRGIFCPRRAGSPFHEPRRLVHGRDRSRVAVAGPRQPFPSARSSPCSPCSGRPCAWLRVAAVAGLTRPFHSLPSKSRRKLTRPGSGAISCHAASWKGGTSGPDAGPGLQPGQEFMPRCPLRNRPCRGHAEPDRCLVT